MAKITINASRGKAVHAPTVKAKAGGGIPGSSSRARVNEAAGQKVVQAKNPDSPKYTGAQTPQGAPKPFAATLTAPNPAPAAADSPHVMPSKHSASVTTSKHGKPATFGDI